MARLSMNEMTTYRWSFEEDVQQYANAGFEALAVWRQKLSDFGEEKGLELLSERGLAVSCLMWAGGFTGSDGRTYKESVEDAQDAIRLAAQLKTPTVLIYSGARDGHTHSHARRLLNSALCELMPFAAEHDVSLAIEPMHTGCAAEWTFLTSLDEALSLIDAVGSPRLKLAFDTYQFAFDDEALARLPELASKIALVQLSDAKGPPCGEQNRCRLGDGKLQLGEIVRTLLAAGYDGYFDIELMGEDLENCDYRELIRQSKQAFQAIVAQASR